MQLQAWLADELMERFNGRIVDITTELARCWGAMLGKSAKKGRSLPVVDALIAATAITNGLIVVTRNRADMSGSGATLLERKGIDTTCMTACLAGKSVK